MLGLAHLGPLGGLVRAVGLVLVAEMLAGGMLVGGCGGRTGLDGVLGSEGAPGEGAGEDDPRLDGGRDNDDDDDGRPPVDPPDLEVELPEDPGPPDSGPRPPCVELPPGETVDALFRLQARLEAADVVFLVDITGSMNAELNRIRVELSSEIVPALVDRIPDLELAVAVFADFPVEPYGTGFERPLVVIQDGTRDLAAVDEAAADVRRFGPTGDYAESQIEALYQLMTGAGAGRFVDAADCPPRRRGAACLRETATPIVFLFTDAPSHNGVGGAFRYVGEVAEVAHGHGEAMDALRSAGARVLGFFSGDRDVHADALLQLIEVGFATESVDTSGNVLVYDIGRNGERLSADVVTAVDALVDEVPIEDVRLELSGPGARFVVDARPAGARPPTGAEETPEGFAGVRPGTRLGFRLTLSNDLDPAETDGGPYLLNLILVNEVGRPVARRRVQIVDSTRGGRCG